MISARIAKVVAGLSLVAASTVGAQQFVAIKLLEPYAPPHMAAVTAFGFYMSPYTGTVNGVTERLNCVDFFHDVTIGETWTAAKINLGDVINNNNLGLLAWTRDGSNGAFGGDLSKVLVAYEEAAWLSAQVPANPGGTSTSSKYTIAIQTAIWSIIDVPNNKSPGQLGYLATVPGDVAVSADTTPIGPGHPTDHLSDKTSTAYWIEAAADNYKSYNSKYYGQFNIITDVYKLPGNGGYAVDLTPASAQEFLFMTPEPATLGLMATGLGVIGYVVRRRRKRAAGELT